MNQRHSVLWTCWDDQTVDSTEWFPDPYKARQAAISSVNPAIGKKFWIAWVADNISTIFDQELVEDCLFELELDFKRRLQVRHPEHSVAIGFVDFPKRTLKRGGIVYAFRFAFISES